MNLWKYLLLLSKEIKKEDQGFTIPIILGFGLFMLLTGITAIKLGSSSETNSKIQKTSAQALAAAEVGVARFQSLVDQARAVAVYDDCVGTRNSAGICPDGGNTASWANAGAILSLTETNVCGGSTIEATYNLIEDLATTTEWTDVSDNPEDGQFRLVSYQYTPAADPSEPPGVGTLIVEGRTSQGVAGATKADGNTFNTGVARVRVEIPVNENILTTTSSVPGLWIKHSNAADMDNDKVNGDILVEGCAVPGGIDTGNLADPSTQKLSFNPNPMPDTPSIAPLLNGGSSTMNYLIGDGIPSADNTPANDPVIDPFAVTSFPRNGDDPAPDGYYHYLIPSLVKNGGADIQIGAGAKVIFYLQGNLDMGGNTSINMQNNGNTPANLQIYGNTVVPNGTGLNGTNFKYGGTQATNLMYFNGTPNVKALIHAPRAAGGVAGGGDPGDASFQGTMWLLDWNPQSGNSKVKIDAVGQLTDLISATSTTKVEPQISVTNSWAREEVPQ